MKTHYLFRHHKFIRDVLEREMSPVINNLAAKEFNIISGVVDDTSGFLGTLPAEIPEASLKYG